MTVFMGFPQDAYEFSADEVGRALAGLVGRESDGTPKVGVLGDGPVVSAVPAAWKVEVGPFTYVDEDSGAVQFSGLSASEQVDITSASGIPAGQSRYDLICWDPETPELVVVEGTPASSPTVPSAGGLAALVRVQVKSGDGATASGQLVKVFVKTWLVGPLIRVDQGKVSAREVDAGKFIDVPVSFESGLFSAAPVVVTGVVASTSVRSVGVIAMNVTKNGFTMRLDSSSTIARTFGAHWRAEQR